MSEQDPKYRLGSSPSSDLSNLELPFFLIRERISVQKFDYQMFQRMVEKKRSLGGVITGTHGTSATRAKQIAVEGFIDNLCDEGGYNGMVAGVYFWDEEYSVNAHFHGRVRAQMDGETQYAIIQAVLNNPSPDSRLGRPQWFSRSVNIQNILNIQFFVVKHRG